MTDVQAIEGSTELSPRPTGGRSLRDPGGAAGAASSWIAIVAIVGFLALTPVAMTFFPGWFEEPTEGPVMIEHTPSSGPLRLIAKYSLGAGELAAGSEGALLEQLDALGASSPSDQLRVAIVAGAMTGPEEALRRLDTIEQNAARPADGAEPKEFGPELEGAITIVRRAFTEGSGSLDQAQRDSIVASEGWFGELLLAQDQPESDPARRAISQNAAGVVALLIGAAVGAGGIGLVGLGLFITAIVLLATGKLRSAYAPPAPGGSVYLEMFALFLVSFVAVQLAAAMVYDASGLDLSRWVVWLVLPAMFWPMARGADLATWRHAVGWHTGKGFWREVGAGILGYFAGLPIVALGLGCAVVLSVVVAALVEWATGGASPPASHPAIDEIGSGGALGVVSLYLLAAVWAPLIEETFFRGALYHHVRGRLGVALSALFVAFIFASIHPQGIGLIPGLMGLAVVFALIRQWRGSIIGCMVAHSMHNATLITVLLLALG
jgi:membrane protease YdiL (CAAX protease family)